MKKNNFKSLMQAAVLICTPLVIASCDDVFGDVDNPVSSHISIKDAPVSLALHKDSVARATYTRTAIAASGAQIEYSSTKPEIATVDAKTGKITAVSGGDCEIIAKATGLDSRGNKTYQEEEVRFPVKVTDYRARVDLIEGAEIPVYNSADASLAQIDMSKIVKVSPADVVVTYNVTNPTAGDVINTSDPTKIVLTGTSGTAKVKATIDKNYGTNAAKFVTKKTYEQESFPENQVSEEFEVTVREGVAYIAGYDATGKELRKTMFKGTGADEYINLSDKLMNATKTAFLNTDVTLDAGWYLVDQSLGGFTKNIRVKGDVNIILNGYTFDIGTGNVMDESAKQNYKLNFFPQKFAAATPASGAATFGNIKEFKEVNILGVNVSAPLNAVENVNIINGSVNMAIGTGTGAVEITNGTSGQLSKFATATINKGTSASWVWSMDHIGTATISEGATVASTISDVENLAINKAASIGNVSKVGTAVIAETPIRVLNEITDLTLNKVKTTGSAALNKIGAVTINKTDGTATFDASVSYPSVTVNALTISDGTVVVNTDIKGFTKTADADTKVTMTGGKLTVNGPAGTVFAILGDVEVSGGTFWACSPDHHAVSGALGGAFEGSTTGADNSWTAITGAERPKYIRNKK